jgi:uncharacterized protein YgiB involved in biofilm formation
MTDGVRRRKSSAYVGFSVLTLSTALAGCEEQPVRAPGAVDAPIYASVADCQKEHAPKDCQDGWSAAQNEHQATAPLYTDRAGCEAEWGQGRCGEATGPAPRGDFTPMLAGFILMNSLNQPLRRPCGPGTGVVCDTGGASGGWGSGGGGRGHAVYLGSGGRIFSGGEQLGEAQRTTGGGLRMPRTVPVVEGISGKVSPGLTTRGGFGRAFGRFGGGGRGG